MHALLAPLDQAERSATVLVRTLQTKRARDTETAREQIAMADFLLLNKTDLVDETHLERIEAKARELNPHAQIFRTNQSQVNLKELLDMHAFDLDRKLAVDPEFLNELNQRHHHDINSFSFEFERPFHVERFEYFVQELSEKEQIFRSKGFLQIAGNPRRAIFHGVNNRFTILWDRLWETGEKRTSQLVFIGRHLDETRLRNELEKCLG